MQSKPRIPTPVRWRAVFYVESGHSYRDTAAEFKIGKSTVEDLWNKYKETGRVEDREGSGRKQRLTKRHKDRIAREAMTFPTMTVAQLTESFNMSQSVATRVSPSTISRTLRERGLVSRIAPEKWLISAKNMQSRVKWCRERLDWTTEDWAGVIFLDESRIQNNPNRKRIRIRKSMQIPADLCQQRNKHDVAVMAWGFISWEGPKHLIFLDTNVNGLTYKNTIKTGLIDRYPMFLREGVVFQHDGAPAHRDRRVKKLFDDHGLNVLEWPAQSPDLNLIEACWREIKSKLKARYEDKWENLDDNFIRKLFISMPDRLKAVIDAKGGPTKYKLLFSTVCANFLYVRGFHSEVNLKNH
jgi:transposase